MEDSTQQETELPVEDDEEDGLTAQTAYLKLQDAWLNEKFAPVILPHQFDLVECMLQQITCMEENIKGLDRSDVRSMIHKLEIDRMRFLIASYLRIRLEKIERYTIHILSQEANRPPSESFLTLAEHRFAKEYLANAESLFRTIALQHMPGNFQSSELNKLSIKPNSQAYVFLRANEKVSGIVLPGDLEGEIDLEPGSQHIIQYSAIEDLVKNGSVQLI